MKGIANCLSITRILLAFLLFFVKPMSLAFYVIYLICGLSDVLDGMIARKTHTTSKLGAKLDSVADLFMVAAVVIVLYPVIHLTAPIVMWIVVIALIRAISMIVVFIQHKTFAILHTYGNKFTGLVLFVLPFTLALGSANILIGLVCLIASLSAIEELLIHLTSKELQINRKSLFSK